LPQARHKQREAVPLVCSNGTGNEAEAMNEPHFQSVESIFRDDLAKRLGAAFASWVAVEPETGARLCASNGRARAGSGHNYVIVLPGETFEERKFDYFARYDFGKVSYSRFKAFSDSEAIEKANARLVKLLKRREKA
jgi:hypothetical protein